MVDIDGVLTAPNFKNSCKNDESLEEDINIYKTNASYKNGTAIIKLLYAIIGDQTTELDINNRSQLEDILYNITGSHHFLNIFESHLSLIGTDNSSNEVYMLSPAVILINLYINMREKALSNVDLMKEDSIKMLNKDEEIRSVLKELGFKNLSKICLNIFNKKISDLYKSDAVYNLEYTVSIEFEKNAKLIDRMGLYFVDCSYESSALNGGEVLRKTYEKEIKNKIENNEFPNNEYGIRKFIKEMRHFQKDISIPIEENKQKLKFIQRGILISETSLLEAEEISFFNKRYKKLFANMSERLFGFVNEEFVEKLSDRYIISDTKHFMAELEKNIQYFLDKTSTTVSY